MRVAIIGSGVAGRAVERALRGSGEPVEVSLHSRSRGFDLVAPGAASLLPPADVYVEATGTAAMGAAAATRFFTRSTQVVAEAANRHGARHILLSIVGCDLPQVQGFGYYAGKAAQERVAHEASERLTLVRTTQWFEFAEQTLARAAVGPIALVPTMLMKPVAVDAVARVIAECALGERAGDRYELAGPEEFTLAELARAVDRARGRRRLRIPLPMPGRMGRAFRGGALVPGEEAEVLGPPLAQWLRERPA